MQDEPFIPVSNPWIAVDLDGTIMEDGHYPNFGPPIPGAREALWELKGMGLKIMIFTARTALTGLDGQFQNVNKAVEQIQQWCTDNDIPCDYVWPMPKPTFIIAFFDDRAIHVDIPGWEIGWDEALEEFKRRYGDKLKNWVKAVLPPEIKIVSKD